MNFPRGTWKMRAVSLEQLKADSDGEPLAAEDLAEVGAARDAFRRGQTVSLDDFERKHGR